jgi:hypothetical protein
MRKTNLARLLGRRSDGIFIAPFEQGEIGPDLLRAACNIAWKDLVSKRRDRPYRAGVRRATVIGPASENLHKTGSAASGTD